MGKNKESIYGLILKNKKAIVLYFLKKYNVMKIDFCIIFMINNFSIVFNLFHQFLRVS